MIKAFLLVLLFISSLYANKVIYLSYDEIPTRIIQGEIFTVTLKALSTVKKFDDISYEFSNSRGLKILDDIPTREKKGKFLYDTFHILATSNIVKLPDVNATLIASQEYNSTFIQGKKLNVIQLNPKSNFSNIIANNLQLNDYKTTSYDNKHNIIVFVLSGENTNIDAIHFKNVYKQGKESSTNSYLTSKITYFVVIDKRAEHFSFTYFNLLKNSFENIDIPVIVDDDSVTTQSDLKPRDQSHDMQKMYAAAAIAILGFILILLKRRIIYLILIFLPLGYILYLSMPEQEICIKKGAQIHILPVDNGIIFETTQTQHSLPKEGQTDHYIKVKLNNNKIGWVKNEDTCSY
ncbi:hypothetical protein [Sulfurimonas sp.]|uniref:hypothetical protein n=1 Tax=Sulfurimonas sp. TaxID=2022749 RepID=UPI00261A0438|nr:hypothetical protein [Sulfurimonas sp.]